MNLNTPCYLVKAREIRAAALYELGETLLHNREVPGLSAEAAYVLTHKEFPQLIDELLDGAAIQVGVFLEPMYKEMRQHEQRLWTEYAYAAFVSNQCSFQLIRTFFPQLSRYKHETYLRENKALIKSKVETVSLPEEHAVFSDFEDLKKKFCGRDVRELYLILSERYPHLSMTAIIKLTLNQNHEGIDL